MPKYFYVRSKPTREGDPPISFSGTLKCMQCAGWTKKSNYKQQCSRSTCVGLPYCKDHLRSQMKLEIRNSRIKGAGQGLFAYDKEALKKNPDNPVVFHAGDKICDYGGDYIDFQEKRRRYGNTTGPYVAQVDPVKPGRQPSDPYRLPKPKKDEEDEEEEEEEDDEDEEEEPPAALFQSRRKRMGGGGGRKSYGVSRRKKRRTEAPSRKRKEVEEEPEEETEEEPEEEIDLAFRDAALNRGAGSMINHVNLARLMNCELFYQQGSNRVSVKATKDILHGEELYCSYLPENRRVTHISEKYVPTEYLQTLAKEDAANEAKRRAIQQKHNHRPEGTRKSAREATVANTTKTKAKDRPKRVLEGIDRLQYMNNIPTNVLLAVEEKIAKESASENTNKNNVYRFDEFEVVETSNKKKKHHS